MELSCCGNISSIHITFGIFYFVPLKCFADAGSHVSVSSRHLSKVIAARGTARFMIAELMYSAKFYYKVKFIDVPGLSILIFQAKAASRVNLHQTITRKDSFTDTYSECLRSGEYYLYMFN